MNGEISLRIVGAHADYGPVVLRIAGQEIVCRLNQPGAGPSYRCSSCGPARDVNACGHLQIAYLARTLNGTGTGPNDNPRVVATPSSAGRSPPGGPERPARYRSPSPLPTYLKEHQCPASN